MDKKFKNFMPKSAVQICIDLCESDLHGDWRTRESVCSELFARLCRLAKRYHTRVLWHGNDRVHQPDKFTFIKNGREYLCHVDGIRYDGVNANCMYNCRYFGTDILTTRTTPNECSKGLVFVSNEDGTCTVFGIGTCTDTDIKIPSVYNGKKVARIGAVAFYGCTGLTSIVIPDSVKSIGNHAFDGCTGLTSIVIPDSVTSIGNGAFGGCSNLTSISVPNGVKSIGDWAFCDCSSLTSIVIPEGVTSIGNVAFYKCAGLTSISIPNSVTSIGKFAFRGCTSLKTITMGNGISLEF